MLDFANVDKHEMLSCIYAKKLLEKLRSLNAELLESENQVIDVIDIEEVEKGICYAKYYHGDQIRDSGEPYYSSLDQQKYQVVFEYYEVGKNSFARTKSVLRHP